MKTFLQETIEVLAENNLTLEDIEFISGDKVQLTLEQFKKFANIKYNNRCDEEDEYDEEDCCECEIYGIPSDIRLYTKDLIFCRREYDGSEWWEAIPKFPAKYKSNLINFDFNEYDDKLHVTFIKKEILNILKEKFNCKYEIQIWESYITIRINNEVEIYFIKQDDRFVLKYINSYNNCEEGCSIENEIDKKLITKISETISKYE